MRISVCDDDREELHRVLAMLENYRERRQLDLHCHGFESATELLAAMDGEDILLLDIMMPGLNGMEAAREIRKKSCLRRSTSWQRGCRNRQRR